MTSYASVTRSALFTNAWNNVYKTLSDHLTDPASRSGVKWIWSSFPVSAIDNKTDYPFVVIDPINVTGSEDYSFDKDVTGLSIAVSAFSVDPDELDTLCDDIIDEMYEQESNFRTYKMQVMSTAGSSYLHEIKSKSFRVHARTLRFNFKAETT
jgi:hypothetical protein